MLSGFPFRSMKPYDRSEVNHQDENPSVTSTDPIHEELEANHHSLDLQSLLEAAKIEAERHNQLHLRALADMQNLRNRFIREKEDLIKTANAMLIEAFLPALDSFRLGFLAAENQPEAQSVVSGFKMAYDQLIQTLKEKGLTVLDPLHEVFDPHAHECLAQKPAEGIAEGIIVEVFRVGYRLGDRLLRPASVIIASGS